jgi:hypothetical protein
MLKRGAVSCKIYVETVSNPIQRNLYHDVTVDIPVTPTTPYYEHKVYIDLKPPKKVVKDLNWWRDDETLPILAYMPYSAGFTPDFGTKIVVGDGHLAGTYVVQKLASYGFDVSSLWVCNIVPYRNSGTTF